MQKFSHPYAHLKQPFFDHLYAINPTLTLKQRWWLWQDIARRYSEAGRTYHTLAHIDQLLSQFARIHPHLNAPHLIALALFYHDVVYDPKRGDNEQKSADYAASLLRPHIGTQQSKRLYALIMMTAGHKLQDKQDTDAAYLLDMDLSILGADWSAYARYAQAVRQEYAHVSDGDYQHGRVGVLTQLLAHPRLYLTPDFAPLEPQARRNIQREVDSLSAHIPC